MTPRSLLAPARLAGRPILRTQTDERLVDLAAAGSGAAFETIVARYRGPLLGYCARILSEQRAEDAVQQTFLKALAALETGEQVRKLRPWLYRIAHNTSLNALRDRALEFEELDESINGVERPDQAFERRQELRDVITAVEALPGRQRDAIVLRELEGRSYEEIATRLGVSHGSVRALLNRARNGIRSGVTALTPVGLLVRLAQLGDGPAAAGLAGTAGAGGAFAAKLCAGAVGCAIAGGVVAVPETQHLKLKPAPQKSTTTVKAAARPHRPRAVPAPARTGTVAARPATRMAPARHTSDATAARAPAESTREAHPQSADPPREYMPSQPGADRESAPNRDGGDGSMPHSAPGGSTQLGGHRDGGSWDSAAAGPHFPSPSH